MIEQAFNSKIPFYASWHEDLQPTPSNFILFKAAQKIKDFILYFPRLLIAGLFNPNKATPFQAKNFEYNNGKRLFFTKQIITPDKVSLRARIIFQKDGNAKTPTFIFFNPLLNSQDDIYDYHLLSLSKRGFNIVTFNHRGRESTSEEKDLVIDGESVYQYVAKELKIAEEQIHFYGSFFGAAIAAQVKVLHFLSGKYVADQTFSSLFDTIEDVGSIKKFGWLIQKISSLIAIFFIAYPLYFLGWAFDTKNIWNKLFGENTITISPKVPLIPEKANLGPLTADEKELISLHFDRK